MTKLKTKKQIYFQAFKKALGDFLSTTILWMHPDELQNFEKKKKQRRRA